ncbi:hypothetical protein ACOI1C_21830, partial [Bacillus sp. DJP31]
RLRSVQNGFRVVLIPNLVRLSIDWQVSEKLHRLMHSKILCKVEYKLGMRFLDEQFNFFELEQAGALTQSMVNALRVVRMLGDFQQHGTILRRYYKQKNLLQNNEFIETVRAV